MQTSAKDLAWLKGQGMWQPGADPIHVLERAKEAGFDENHPHLLSFVLGYYDAGQTITNEIR
jgi:hypothetical protein